MLTFSKHKSKSNFKRFSLVWVVFHYVLVFSFGMKKNTTLIIALKSVDIIFGRDMKDQQQIFDFF